MSVLKKAFTHNYLLLNWLKNNKMKFFVFNCSWSFLCLPNVASAFKIWVPMSSARYTVSLSYILDKSTTFKPVGPIAYNRIQILN